MINMLLIETSIIFQLNTAISAKIKTHTLFCSYRIMFYFNFQQIVFTLNTSYVLPIQPDLNSPTNNELNLTISGTNQMISLTLEQNCLYLSSHHLKKWNFN